jgi:hypothetical protein
LTAVRSVSSGAPRFRRSPLTLHDRGAVLDCRDG